MNNIFSISLSGDWFLLKSVKLSCWHVSAHLVIFMSACIAVVVHFMLSCTNFGFQNINLELSFQVLWQMF